jgi:hypothetical protein
MTSPNRPGFSAISAAPSASAQVPRVPSFARASLKAVWYNSAARAWPAAKPSAAIAPRRSNGTRWCAASPALINSRMAPEAANAGCASLANTSTASTRSAGSLSGTIFRLGFEPGCTRRFDFTIDRVPDGNLAGKSGARRPNRYARVAPIPDSGQSSPGPR